jgi:hypothetical protein
MSRDLGGRRGRRNGEPEELEQYDDEKAEANAGPARLSACCDEWVIDAVLAWSTESIGFAIANPLR